MTAVDHLQQRDSSPTEARRIPVQARALKRREQILDTTAELLARVGVDDLTTILIAKSLGISVGSLYHYFPNKIAILYALAQRWLSEINTALDEIESNMPDREDLLEFTNRCTARVLEVYRRQHGILHLVQAMFTIPELRALDEQHDQVMILRLSAMLSRLGFEHSARERERIATIYLELIHALALIIVEQKGQRAAGTTEDLKFMAYSLLARYHRA